MTLKNVRRVVIISGGIVVIFAVAFLIYFPGRQTPIAITLATGIGVSGLQGRVDRLEDKAIKREEFQEGDKAFLRNLYTCFAKGARLTLVLRQSSEMMRRYLSRSGEDLRTTPRVFVKSRPVQMQMNLLKQCILKNSCEPGSTNANYSSDTFYMGDPKFFDSFIGLYFGRVLATTDKAANGSLTVHWRAECPWEWPSYESLFQKYGDHHAQCFPLPNALSVLLGSQHCLRIDDGLGGCLVSLDIAKPFLVYSEWTEIVSRP